MARSFLATTAGVVLYINGSPYALATSFRWDSATPPKLIMGVDSAEPYELAPTTSKIMGQIGLLRQIGDGGLEGAGIAPTFANLPKGKYFSMALIDRSTDLTLFRADRCWCASQSWDLPSKGRMTGQMAFEAMDWSNEAG